MGLLQLIKNETSSWLSNRFMKSGFLWLAVLWLDLFFFLHIILQASPECISVCLGHLYNTCACKDGTTIKAALLQHLASRGTSLDGLCLLDPTIYFCKACAIRLFLEVFTLVLT